MHCKTNLFHFGNLGILIVKIFTFSYLVGSVLTPITGLSLVRIFDAASRNVPSPPAVNITSAQSRTSLVKVGR